MGSLLENVKTVEAEPILRAFVYIFESKGKGLAMLKFAFNRDIELAGLISTSDSPSASESALFKSDSLATKMVPNVLSILTILVWSVLQDGWGGLLT